MKAEDRCVISVTLPPDLLADIDALAGRLDLNRSQFLRSAARKEIEQQKRAAAVSQPPVAQEVAA